MPQYPYGPRYGGSQSKLDVHASTVIKATPGTMVSINVTAVSGTIGIYDMTALASVSATYLIDTLDATTEATGPRVYNFPCFNGICVVFSSTGTVSVAYS